MLLSFITRSRSMLLNHALDVAKPAEQIRARLLSRLLCLWLRLLRLLLLRHLEFHRKVFSMSIRRRDLRMHLVRPTTEM